MGSNPTLSAIHQQEAK